MRKQILPHPILFLTLVLMWMMLTRFSIGHLILGSVVALIAARVFAPLEPQTVRIRRWRPIPGLLGVMFVDIMRSNLRVAAQVLSRRAPNSVLVEVELESRHRSVLAILAIIITATPGTAWLGWNPRTGILLMHVLDTDEKEEWKTLMQTRYECRLREIFEWES